MANIVKQITLYLDESLQFAQMMSIAQGVGLPVIVNDDAGDIRQETATLGADPIEGQQGGRRHMQPVHWAAYGPWQRPTYILWATACLQAIWRSVSQRMHHRLERLVRAVRNVEHHAATFRVG